MPFAKNANCGLIGTMANIPNRFVAESSLVFYQHLLGGTAVGVALYGARNHLPQQTGNPLGILYARFGDAGPRVAPIITSVHG